MGMEQDKNPGDEGNRAESIKNEKGARKKVKKEQGPKN